MIGLTLVVSMGVFASSLKASFGDVLGDQTNADLYVASSSAQAPGFSPAAIDGGRGRRRRRRGLRHRVGRGPLRRRRTRSYSSVDPATAEDAMNLDVSAGSIATSARTASWSPRPPRRRTAGSSATRSRRCSPRAASTGCTWPASTTARAGSRTTSSSAWPQQNAFAGPQLVSTALVTIDAGADQDEVQDAIAAALADHPDAKVLDQDGFEKEASGFIDQLLTFVTVMLPLAVLIALLGIVNTLALSVFERTRELGLLRAVGMTRGQVRAMVRWESAVISLIGALSGAALGIGIGLAMSQLLKDEGIKSISIPVARCSCTSPWPRSPACSPPSVRPGPRPRSTSSRRWSATDTVRGEGPRGIGHGALVAWWHGCACVPTRQHPGHGLVARPLLVPLVARHRDVTRGTFTMRLSPATSP